MSRLFSPFRFIPLFNEFFVKSLWILPPWNAWVRIQKRSPFLKWLSLSRINIPGVFSFGYSSTVTQYTALLLQNGLSSILKSHTYSYCSCICQHIHVIQNPKRNLKIILWKRKRIRRNEFSDHLFISISSATLNCIRQLSALHTC